MIKNRSQSLGQRLKVCLLPFLLPPLLLLHPPIRADDTTGSDTPVSTPQQIVDHRRAFYNEQFKEIQFVFFQGGADWMVDIDVLSILLGPEPSNLGYEHPPDLRKELMDVTVTVFIERLRRSLPNSHLFKADSPLGWRENVCAISLNAEALAGDDIQATAYMYDLDAAKVSQLAPEDRLNPTQFLHYLIDHEVFHCLDAYYNGPQPMSHEALWGEYHDFRRENGADAFALGMNLRQQGEAGSFLHNIQATRALSVQNGDIAHWTHDAVAQLLEIPVEELQGMSMQDLLARAADIRNRLVGSYQDYLLYHYTALQAMKKLDPEGVELTKEETAAAIDPELLGRLLEITRRTEAKHPHLAQ